MMNYRARALLLLCLSATLWASIGFKVSSIRVDGLVNVSRKTFNSYLQVHPGDQLRAATLRQVIQRLYQSGFFKDVQVMRSDQQLTIKVIERPTMAFVGFSDEKTLQKEEIQGVLTRAKLVAGRPYNARLIKQVKQTLLHLSKMRGVHDIAILVDLEQLPGNRMRVMYRFKEGEKTKVKKIIFSGNQQIQSSALLDVMSLQPKLWSFLTDSDSYSIVKFNEDLAKIKDYYFNHGYLKFKVVSHRPVFDAKAHTVDLHITIHEGPQYRIGQIKVDQSVADAKLVKGYLKDLQPGQVFSSAKVVDALKLIQTHYQDDGYAHVAVLPQMQLDSRRHVVNLRIKLKKGPLVLVRHVSFFGNTTTNDAVLRREMLQNEVELFSASHVAESVRRINNLGYVRNASCKPVDVKGHQDLVDLDCFITESPAISASVSLGYGSQNGALFQVNFSHKSLLGTGYGVQFNVTRMLTAEQASLSLYNPYFTKSGISQNISFHVDRMSPSRKNKFAMVDRKKLDVAYESKGASASLDYGLPMMARGRLSVGTSVRTTTIKLGTNPDPSFQSYISQFGKRFRELTLRLGWHYNGLDRAIFPRTGGRVDFDAEMGLPVNDWLRYYKLDLKANWYQPIGQSKWIAKVRGGVGYGRGYGQRGRPLPFFKHYFAGGMDTVRGFASNSLGKKDSESRAIGGDMMAYGGAAIILPDWLGADVRLSLFVDGGAVGAGHLSAKDLRYSAGVAVLWRTAIAPLVFSLAVPLEKKSGDQKEIFAFELGAVF